MAKLVSGPTVGKLRRIAHFLRWEWPRVGTKRIFVCAHSDFVSRNCLPNIQISFNLLIFPRCWEIAVA